MGATKSKHASAQSISRPATQAYNKLNRNTAASASASYESQSHESSQYGYRTDINAANEIHKGLHNEVSAYHCFLNVIIQSLWHLHSWRKRFEALDFNHLHHCDPCIFCALRTIFVAFEYSDSTIIPPDQLRQALNDGDLKQARDRFRIGSMGDAEEALDFILRWLHSEQVTRANEDVCDQEFHADVPCSPQCISHLIFGGQYMDCRVCEGCKGLSDPEPMNSFLYRVYAAELLSQFDHNNAPGTTMPSFEDRLKHIYKSPQYSCPNNADSGCIGPAFVDRWLLHVPLVFALMFVWPPEVDRQDIALIWSVLPRTLSLNLFLRTHTEGPIPAAYILRGIVGFYGQHYMAFFWSISHNAWLMFDDRRVVIVGDWYDLCKRVTAGKIRPILVFFETPDDVGGSHSDSRSLAATMETERVREHHHSHTSSSNISTSSSTSESSTQQQHASPSINVDDVFGDLNTLDYATPRETQTQIASTRRR